MMNRSIHFALFLCMLMAFSAWKPAAPGKAVIIGRFVKSDSCRDYARLLPPGAVMTMKDPCGIECSWFDVKDRDNTKNPEIRPDAAGNFLIEVPISDLSCFSIYSVYHRKYFFMCPGDTVQMTITDTDLVNPVILEPKPDTAQSLYLSQWSRIYSSLGFTRWKKSLNDSLLDNIQVYIDSCIRPFSVQQSKNLCSPEFFDFVATEIRYYVAYQVSQTLWYTYEHDTLKSAEKKMILSLLDKIYLRIPLYSRKFITPDGTGYNDYILTWIWLQYLKSGKETDKYKGDPAKLPDKLALVRKQLTNGAYELFALDLIDTHAQRMDTIALTVFRKFQEEFPQSASEYGQRYQYTEKSIHLLQDFMKAAAARAGKAIQFMDGSLINSLDDLIKRFPGKQVYVDMWATWCKPCIQLFDYNAGIRPFLKEHGITEVFLSLDKDSLKWKTAVKYYDLQGVNIQANPSLLKDLRKNIGWNGGIPRFFIISREGKLTAGDAVQPIAKEKLFRQLLSQ